MILVIFVCSVFVLLIFFWLYSRLSAQKPQIYVKEGTLLGTHLPKLPCLNEVFYPTWWCPFGFLQTAIRQLLRDRPVLSFERELVTLDDGGQLAVDWRTSPNAKLLDSSPIVVFLPGITGSTHDCAYILYCVLECDKLGYRSLVVNPRGLGGIPLKTAQTYNAAWTSDFKHVLSLCCQRYPNAPKIGCGFSMGGMILWNYLASCATAEETRLKAGLCISSPFDPVDSSLSIERFFPRIFFNRHLANGLKRIVTPYKMMFEGLCNWDEVMAAKTVREFDTSFTVPLFKYKSWSDYYHAAALYWKVKRIPIPTLCLNAADDCFSPISSVPFEDIVNSDNVAVVVTKHGGHTSFMKEFNPSAPGLVEEVLMQFAKTIFAE